MSFKLSFKKAQVSNGAHIRGSLFQSLGPATEKAWSPQCLYRDLSGLPAKVDLLT